MILPSFDTVGTDEQVIRLRSADHGCRPHGQLVSNRVWDQHFQQTPFVASAVPRAGNDVKTNRRNRRRQLSNVHFSLLCVTGSIIGIQNPHRGLLHVWIGTVQMCRRSDVCARFPLPPFCLSFSCPPSFGLRFFFSPSFFSVSSPPLALLVVVASPVSSSPSPAMRIPHERSLAGHAVLRYPL